MLYVLLHEKEMSFHKYTCTLCTFKSGLQQLVLNLIDSVNLWNRAFWCFWYSTPTFDENPKLFLWTTVY